MRKYSKVFLDKKTILCSLAMPFENFTSPVLRQPADNSPDTSVAGLIVAKATAMCVLFVAAAIFGLIPFKLADWFRWRLGDPTVASKSAHIVAALLAFGGGVLIATTFLHLLPEVAENVEQLQAAGRLPTLQFHLAELLMCAGFFAMYFVEELVHGYMHRQQFRRDAEAQAFERGQSVRHSVLSVDKAAAKAKMRSAAETQQHGRLDLEATGERTATDPERYQHRAPSNAQQCGPPSAGHAHGHSHMPVKFNEDDQDIVVSSLRGLLIVLALSIHELFEGLAVGLERAPAHVWYMFGAVAAHKLVLAFCVGVELISTRTRRWLAVVYVLSFAVVSPIGIGIGILVSGGGGGGGDGESADTQMVSTILQGLACGTLLYVVFFEILQKNRSGMVQMVAVLVGFLVMFGLQFIGKCVCVCCHLGAASKS